MAAVVIVVLGEGRRGTTGGYDELKFDKSLKIWYNILEDDKGKSLFCYRSSEGSLITFPNGFAPSRTTPIP